MIYDVIVCRKEHTGRRKGWLGRKRIPIGADICDPPEISGRQAGAQDLAAILILFAISRVDKHLVSSLPTSLALAQASP